MRSCYVHDSIKTAYSYDLFWSTFQIDWAPDGCLCRAKISAAYLVFTLVSSLTVISEISKVMYLPLVYSPFSKFEFFFIAYQSIQ